MKKLDICILVCSSFHVYSPIARSNRKHGAANTELFFSAAVVPEFLPHFPSLNTCSYFTIHQPMPASQKVPYCSAQNTWRCLALWGIWATYPGGNRGPLTWHSPRSAPSACPHVGSQQAFGQGRKEAFHPRVFKPAIVPSSRKPQAHLFAKCFKNKMG